MVPMLPFSVMPGLVPGIHVLERPQRSRSWMAGTSPRVSGKVFASDGAAVPGTSYSCFSMPELPLSSWPGLSGKDGACHAAMPGSSN
jgi:hypothetical protein